MRNPHVSVVWENKIEWEKKKNAINKNLQKIFINFFAKVTGFTQRDKGYKET
jgi:hypothetical protein